MELQFVNYREELVELPSPLRDIVRRCWNEDLTAVTHPKQRLARRRYIRLVDRLLCVLERDVEAAPFLITFNRHSFLCNSKRS